MPYQESNASKKLQQAVGQNFALGSNADAELDGQSNEWETVGNGNVVEHVASVGKLLEALQTIWKKFFCDYLPFIADFC